MVPTAHTGYCHASCIRLNTFLVVKAVSSGNIHMYKELRKVLMVNTTLQGSAKPCFRGVRISFVSGVKEFSL